MFALLATPNKMRRAHAPLGCGFWPRGLAVLAAIMALIAGAQADRLIVVAVDKYPGGNELGGCVADAKDVEAALKKFVSGPTVELFDEKATQKKILGALDDAVKNAKNEKVVVYFSGHGTDEQAPGSQNQTAAICPIDFEGSQAGYNLVAFSDLAARLAKIEENGCAVTAVLDCCYSGGVVKSKGAQVWYRDKALQKPIKGPQLGLQFDDPLKQVGKVCYFTACNAKQRAIQIQLPGPDARKTGLFTLAFLDTLKTTNLQGKDLTWGAVAQAVQGRVEAVVSKLGLSDPPVPDLSDGFAPVPLFARLEDATKVHANPKTLRDVFDLTNPRKDLLDVEMTPNLSSVLPGQRVALKFKFGTGGYLVGLERIGDLYYRFYPTTGEPTTAHFGPTDMAPLSALYFELSASEDNIKFILYSDKEKALDVAKEFPFEGSGPGLTDAQIAGQVAAKEVDADDGVPFVTVDLAMTVNDLGPDLLGGGDLSDHVKLYRALKAPLNDVSKHVAFLTENQFPGRLAKYPAEGVPHEYVAYLINRLTAKQSLWDKDAFQGVKLDPETTVLLSKPQLDDPSRRRLNLLLLAAAFPDCIQITPPKAAQLLESGDSASDSLDCGTLRPLSISEPASGQIGGRQTRGVERAQRAQQKATRVASHGSQPGRRYAVAKKYSPSGVSRGKESTGRAMVFARATNDPDFRRLTQCRVTVDDKSATFATPIYESSDDILIPAAETVKYVTHGLAELNRVNGEEIDVLLDGKPIIRILDTETSTSAAFLLPGARKRTAELPGGFEEKGGHLLIAAHLLGWLFGDTVKTDANLVEIRTPAYWEAKLGCDSAHAQGKERLLATLAYIPDFGISPPAERIALWVRPSRDVRGQIYAISPQLLEPTALLRVRDLGQGVTKRRVGAETGDQPNEWSLAANHTTLVVQEFAAHSVGSETTYALVLTDKPIGDGDPQSQIAGSTPPADQDWAVFGIYQTVGPTLISYDFHAVKSGETIPSIAKATETPEGILCAINGLQPGDTLDKDSTLIVTKRDVVPAPVAEKSRDYQEDGLYCAKIDDTIPSLAAAWKVSTDDVINANPDLVPGAVIENQEILARIRPITANVSTHPLRPVTVHLFRALVPLELHTDPDEKSPVTTGVPAGSFVVVDDVVVGTDYYLGSFNGKKGFVLATAARLAQFNLNRPVPVPQSSYVAIATSNNPLVKQAVSLIGLRYDWGGNSLKGGIDCSHFVQRVFGQAHDGNIPAPVINQENYGKLVQYKGPELARRDGRTIRLPQDYPNASTDLNVLTLGDRFIIQRKLSEADKSRHTGIYLGTLRWNGRNFLHGVIHAGSHGVTISELNSRGLWGDYKYSVRGTTRG